MVSTVMSTTGSTGPGRPCSELLPPDRWGQHARLGYSLDFIQSMLSETSGRAAGWFKDLELATVFQPIFSLAHNRVIGFDASVRSTDPEGRPVAAATLFGPVQNYAEASLLDLLCSTLHLRNFLALQPARGLLFLNLHPEVFLDSKRTADFIRALLEHYGVPEGRIAIDIPGSALNAGGLETALRDYRRAGCLICIDDFGLENSNLDTVWDSNPLMVKMAPSVIVDAIAERRNRQALLHAISLLHEMGTLVLIEGVETEMQALVAIDVDADFASGFYFDSLSEAPGMHSDSSPVLESVWSTYKKKRDWCQPSEAQPRTSLERGTLRSSQIGKLQNAPPEEMRRYRESRRPFINAIRHAAVAVCDNEPMPAACAEFLALPGAIRCYLLDVSGKPIGEDLPAPQPPVAKGVDFQALAGGAKPDWFRRDFFRRARSEPEVVQVTRKYCSLIGHAQCVTFSIGITVKERPAVLCGDVDWSRFGPIVQ